MTASHLEFLVEEPSMEAFLGALLPRLAPPDITFRIHAFQGKRDMLGKLEARLKGYARWFSDDVRIVVVIDRDEEDCHGLKQRLEDIAAHAGLRTRSSDKASWRVVNRIAVEELEAWYFGDWEAVRCAYPRVSPNIPRQAKYRNPDAIGGGTWEAFERILQRNGYFESGLGKREAARNVAACMDPDRNCSPSFQAFRNALSEATS